jgi:hypothetical protein
VTAGANQARQLSRERRNLATALRFVRGERLATECWCHREILSVPADVVRRGQTWSCGAPGCGPAA